MARRGENIRKRKDGRWEGRYIKARTPEGKIQWGYVYGTVYAEVKRVLIQKKAEAGFYNLKRTDLTFEALAEVWLHSQRNAVKESTYAHYSYTLHKYLLPVLSKVPVASLEESFLEQAMQQIIAPIDAAHKPLGNSSARECLSMLRRICKYAAHLRLIRPMELEVALPKAIGKISAPLSPAEQQRLYQYVQENPTPRKIGLLLGLELGLRIGEICGLQWGDFDLKLETLKINRTVCRISCGNGHTKVVIQTPKTRTSRREIPIPKQLLIMLKKLRGCVSNAAWFLSGNESKPTEPRCYRKSIKAYEEQTYQLSEGDCVFIDCRKAYSHSTSDNLWSLQWCHFYAPSLPAVYEKYKERGGRPVFHPADIKPFTTLLTDIYDLASSSDYIRDMRINEKLGTLLTLLMEQSWHPESMTVSRKRLELAAVKEYLDEHYTEKIALDDLSEHFFINKFYLSKIFRETYGTTVNNYLISKRITRAKQLLRFTDMTVDEVGAAVGMGDANYFSRMFRKVEGISPREYRKQW